MAPAPDSVYFPPLERCLEDGQLLISWRQILMALEGYRGENDDRLKQLLLEADAQDILARPYDPFPVATSQTRSSFETRTAAINVTPSADSRYNITEIKDDALWLSKEVGIDELSALRVVVLEYQSRSQSQLLCDFSPEEKASLREVSGNTNTETSNLVPQTLLTSEDAFGQTAEQFESSSARHLRSIRIYLLERQHVLKCAQFLFQATQSSLSVENLAQDKGKQREEEPPIGIEVGRALLSKVQGGSSNFNTFIVSCTQSLDRVCNGLQNGGGWCQDELYQDQIEVDWFNNQIIEVVQTMEMVLWFLEKDKNGQPRHEILSGQPAEVVQGWFTFVAAYGFFDSFESPFQSVQPLISSLQSLVATISLALIDPWSSTAFFNDRDPMHHSEENSPYVTNLDAVAKINRILLDAAIGLSPVASPAVFGWSIILREVRSTSVGRREARELRQSQRAIDGIEGVSPNDEDHDSQGASSKPSRRRNSASSDLSLEGGIHDKIMDVIMDSPLEEDPIEYLARSAVDGSKVFDILTSLASSGPALSFVSKAQTRLVILDCVRCTLNLLGYIPEVATTILACLVGDQQFWDLENCELMIGVENDPIAAFCLDDLLREFFLGSAISRYPYESSPFLKLSRAIASCQNLEADSGGPVLLTWLSTLRSITYELPYDFRDYETIQEEDNMNTIQLTEPAALFQPRGNKTILLRGSPDHDYGLALGSNEFVIPEGTTGRIISESDPKVACWFHNISGLKYLGKLLETAVTSGDFVDGTTYEPVDRESLVDIVAIMATLILTSNRIERFQSGKLDTQGPTHRILEEASDGLSRNRDVVSVIFSIFEEELQRQADGSDDSLDLLVACVQFIYALVPILPGRVWPLLGRSGLLEINGRGGKLATVFSGIELVSGRYDFLTACIRLLDALVEDSVTNAVVRKSRSKTMARFGTPEDLGTGVPAHILSTVLFSFTKAACETLVGSCNWKFADPKQRLVLSKLTTGVLEKILQYTYSIDDLSKPSSKLTGALAKAADHIIQTFLSNSSGHLRFQPFLRALLDGQSTPNFSSDAGSASLWRQCTRSTLQLSTTLLRLSTLTEIPSVQFEAHLFKASPLIVRLYAVHEEYQEPVIKVLDALVICAASSEKEPPSLLGYLGSQTSKNFLHMLSSLGKPLDNDSHTISIWRLMSSVVSNRQQWFAIYLLTGRTPRAALEKSDPEKASIILSKPLLEVALDSLLQIETLSYQRAVAMLEFVSLAQNFWPWAMGDLQKSDFISAISAYVAKIEPVAPSAKIERCIEGCYQARMAALIAEILAMYLYHRRQLGDAKPAQDVLTHISFYTRSAVSVPFYNSSLHGNLARNFEAKFSGCTLENLKRTHLNPREIGKGFFYDVALADKMLGLDQAWTGKKNNGLADELLNANVNLSLVDAQVSVLNGWKMLVTELSSNVGSNESLQRVLAKTIADSLVSNTRAQLPEKVFTHLNQTRADLALILTQRLVEARSKIPECLNLLRIIWDTVCQVGTSFELALLSDNAYDATYYRTLLKILFLALHPHAGLQEPTLDLRGLGQEEAHKAGQKIAQVSARTQLLLEMINKIVFHGFRDVVRALHELPDISLPDDIALLTGVLQATMNIPGMELSHGQIASSMSSSDVARVATTLFSWSDKLAIDGDPIYGELSVKFLLELSSIPAIAEQLALEGVLGQIASASITGYLRKPNVSPYAEGAGPQRCYAIWAKGILPLLLNLLDAVGSSIASEVAIFLNQFPNLLSNSVMLIDTPSSSSTSDRRTKFLCYASVQEISYLTLISFVLSRFRDGMKGVIDVQELQWDILEVRESVEWWLGSRAVLRERIVPLGEREMLAVKERPVVSGNSKTRLEEMIVGELEGVRDVLNGGEV